MTIPVVLATLAVITLAAFLVESLTEYFFGLPMNNIPKLTKFKWTLPYVSLTVGVGCVLAFWKFDILYLCGQWFNTGELVVAPSLAGQVLTGAAIGRGASYIHEILGYFKKPPMPAA